MILLPGGAAVILEDAPAEVGNRGRTFVALSRKALAISASVCFHDASDASTEEVHMKTHPTNRQMPKPCAAAVAGHRALLG
jgi:hypothetical protein